MRDASATNLERTALHQQADNLHLAARPGWQSLLHIAPGNTTSDAVDDWFFFADHGRENANAELHATLDALIDNPTVAIRDEPAACVFAARRAFLAMHLGETFTRLAANVDCPRRAAWLASLDAQQLWLVFPAGYLNSPSSMFGHTLLRIDSTESRTRGPLLAYAANFAAETTESNGLTFAIKGIAGGYIGRYGVLPYYEKVREYVRLESRDLWEYPLQLDADEQQRLLLHLWELRGAGFSYYFFSRNCAYQLLSLLQTLRPEQDFLSGFQIWAAPTDTIRVLQEFGLVGTPNFRPALATSLRDRAAQLTPAQRQQAVALSRAGIKPDVLANEPPKTRAQVLDVAHDLIYLRFQNGGDRDTLLATDRQLLAARAATGSTSDFTPVPRPDTPPDRGHHTQRAAVGWLGHEGAQSLLLRYRPSYHDLLDNPSGYTLGSQINFGDTALRMDLRNGAVKVQAFRLIDIISLAARDALTAPISWRVSVGARRDVGIEAPLRGYFDAAPGLAWAGSRGFVYAYLPLTLESGPRLQHSYDVRAGIETSALFFITPQLRSLASVLWQGGVLGAAREQRRGSLGVQLDLNTDWALRAEGVAEDFSDDGQRTHHSAIITVQHYF